MIVAQDPTARLQRLTREWLRLIQTALALQELAQIGDRIERAGMLGTLDPSPQVQHF